MGRRARAHDRRGNRTGDGARTLSYDLDDAKLAQRDLDKSQEDELKERYIAFSMHIQ